MDWSSRRIFPRLGLVVAVLLVATLVNWEVPARALGLDGGGPVCDWPEPPESPEPYLEVTLSTCPRPDRASGVQVWLHTDEPVRDVNLSLASTADVVGGSADWSGDAGPGETRLATMTLAFSGRSGHTVEASATATVPRDRGGFREATLRDLVVVELSPSCTLAYRGARPTGRWVCPR